MNALSQYSDINLHTVPGQYRELSKGFIGINTCEYVEHFNFDYCIIGAEGIGIESGVSLLDKDDAFTKIAVMKQSRCKILVADRDRKSTRLNSSHVSISYAVFCLKKKKRKTV